MALDGRHGRTRHASGRDGRRDEATNAATLPLVAASLTQGPVGVIDRQRLGHTISSPAATLPASPEIRESHSPPRIDPSSGIVREHSVVNASPWALVPVLMPR